MAGISSWSRSDRIAFFSLIVTIVGVIAAIAVIPGVRVFLGLEHPAADVIVCLSDARYAPDPNPAPDHGVVDPVYLHTTFNLRNKGSAQATVTDIFIDYLGIYLSNGQSVHTTRTYKLNSPLTIAGNGEVPGMMFDQLVGQRSENKLESARTQVFWEGGGTGQILNPTFDGVSWQNGPACSS
jgi:hypothetical protein